MREKILILVLLCRFSLCDKSYYVVMLLVWTRPYTTNLRKRLQVSGYDCNKYVTFINPDVQDDMLPNDWSCVLSGVFNSHKILQCLFPPIYCRWIFSNCQDCLGEPKMVHSFTSRGEYHLTCKQALFPLSSSKGRLKRNVSKPKARV